MVAAARVPNLQAADLTRRFASGWGTTKEAAVENCAREIAERVAAQVSGDEVLRHGCADALDGLVVTPPQLMLIDDAQHLTEARAGSDVPSAKWDAATSIDWLAADAGLGMARAWVPAGLCFLGHARDRIAGLSAADSNGLAAGNTREDAAVRAFLELVERDAVAIWWYNRLRRPQLDPADLEDPLILAYAGWTVQRGRRLSLLDLTHDLGLPVIAAVSDDGQGRRIALGFGAGCDAATAARHAIGELTQFDCNIDLIEQRAGRHGEAGLAPEVRRLLRWWREATIGDHSHLAGTSVAAPPGCHAVLDLAACHDICRRHELTFLAVDLTRPVLGVPVVRVLVPGLRPMAPRFAAGRLYDVPVQLNWLPQALRRQDLNRQPMVF